MHSDLGSGLTMARDAEARLTLSQVRAVALPSRLRILRCLAKQRATVTEVSKRTGIPKTSALKHLRVLARHDLVQPRKGERKWVYYDLTRAGRSVGKLEPLRIFVLLSLALGAALLAGALGTWWWGVRPHASGPWGVPPIGGEPVEPGVLVAAIALAAAGGVFLAAAGAMWAWSRARKVQDPDEPTDTSSSR